MLNKEHKQELKRDALTGHYTIKELCEKYQISEGDYWYYKKQLGFTIKPSVKPLSQEQIRYIKEHPELSIYALSLELEVSYQKLKNYFNTF